jgi:hypothetical protein
MLMIRFNPFSVCRAAVSLRRSITEPTTTYERVGVRLIRSRASERPKPTVPFTRDLLKLLLWYRVLINEYRSYSENTDGALSLLDYASTRPAPL